MTTDDRMTWGLITDVLDLLERHGYQQVIAKKIKGFPKEVVIVDRQEYQHLDADVRKALFQGR